MDHVQPKNIKEPIRLPEKYEKLKECNGMMEGVGTEEVGGKGLKFQILGGKEKERIDLGWL